MRLIGPADYRRMPWKNGGGTTTEIAISPPDTGLDAFDWRVSMATVAEPGPFSRFSGVDRTLCVLEGNGIRLDIDGEAVALTRDSTPFAFAADAEVFGTPLNGPIADLNVMTRRGRYRHAVSRMLGAQSLSVRTAGWPSLILAIAPCRIASPTGAIDLPAGATVLIEDATDRRSSLTAIGKIEVFAIDLVAL